MMVLRRRWLLKIVICDKHALDTAVSSTPPPHHQSTTTTSTIIPRTLARRLTAVDSSPGWTRGRPARGKVAACKVDRPANLLNARGLKCTCDQMGDYEPFMGGADFGAAPCASPMSKEAPTMCITKDVNQMRSQTPRIGGAALAQLVNAHRPSMTQLQQVKNIRGRAASCSFYCGTAPGSVAVMISAKPSLPWGSWVS